MHYLVGTDSVHTTAAACDYLAERATDADTVTVVAVVLPDADELSRRDGEEALTVAPVRLATVGTVETEVLEGEPAETILETAADVDADEIVVGARSGAPDTPVGLGSTAASILTDADRPVVVVPLPEL
ncbi:universal stress protein [Halobacteria archaeon AArc-m2/3/4]|uniref:Universal stress protein n=1 Tax=Natronoglomus mannanivorans TaxID=2979990 RepID=A0AAP2YXL2_9EURY|nr:universal stress protein [Halobacteria archaeon AArc-xg1-1]MCU4973383.1 universal stress protein [Halobacteria archaeon AArc-m2/3/4]